MTRIHKFVITYFLLALPVMMPMLFPSIAKWAIDFFSTHPWVSSGFGFVFGAWMLCALYFGVALVVSPGFRESLLRRLLRVKDRDEREAMITAAAAKRTFFSSMALTTLLLLLTMFQVNVRQLKPEEIRPGGGTRMLSLGLKFSPWKTQGEQVGQEIFGYDFPVTPSGVLLLLLVWQVGAFTWNSRRELV